VIPRVRFREELVSYQKKTSKEDEKLIVNAYESNAQIENTIQTTLDRSPFFIFGIGIFLLEVKLLIFLFIGGLFMEIRG
jgi:hypothetical protein